MCKDDSLPLGVPKQVPAVSGAVSVLLVQMLKYRFKIADVFENGGKSLICLFFWKGKSSKVKI